MERATDYGRQSITCTGELKANPWGGIKASMMERFALLLQMLSEEYPDDWWIRSYAEACEREEDLFLDQAKIYSKAIRKLDDKSWGTLKKKAMDSFKQTILRRGKQAFFNLLNEALAYEYLVDKGQQGVSLLPERKEAKTPDISYSNQDDGLFCEVKTLSVSEEELDRAEAQEVYDGEVYSQLGKGFFNKLSSALNTAIEQIPSESPDNLVYVILHFDDFVGHYYETYGEQIDDFLTNNYPKVQVYCRVGLYKRLVIHHKPENA